MSQFVNAVPFGAGLVVNLTPHAIVFRDAVGVDTTFPAPPKGGDARVSQVAPAPDPDRTAAAGFPIAFPHADGDVTGLPAPVPGHIFIVSMLVRQHPSVRGRADVVSPGTGPADGAIRHPMTLADGSKNPVGGLPAACTVFIGA